MNTRGIIGSVKAMLADISVVDGHFHEASASLNQILSGLPELPRRPVLRVLDRLCRDGDLKLQTEALVSPAPGESGPKRRNPTWLIVRDLRQRRDNQVKARVTCRDKIWGTLRSLRRAMTLSELCRLTGCGENVVREYLLMLVRHEYVAAKGKIGREKAWMLVNDCGPRRPETPEATS
jgi:hypothetical protein